MKPKVVSIAALIVLMLLPAAMACSNGDLESPPTGLKESTPKAMESKTPTDGHPSSVVFPAP